MAVINGKRSTFCMQGREQALSTWPLAFSQTTPRTSPKTSTSPHLRGENGESR